MYGKEELGSFRDSSVFVSEWKKCRVRTRETLSSYLKAVSIYLDKTDNSGGFHFLSRERWASGFPNFQKWL